MPDPALPEIDITNPDPGYVTKTIKVKVQATSAVDDPGTLDVDVKVGGSWLDTTWNPNGKRYEYQWDTTQTDPGPVTIKARVTESTGTTVTASDVVVDVKADYASEVLGDGAVAYWKLNDGGTFAKDSVDGTHKAKYNSTNSQTPPLIGEGGKSATFDGNNIITVNNNLDLNTGPSYPARTIELWFEATDKTGRHVLWEEGGSSRGISVYTKAGKLYAGAWNRTGAEAWPADVFVNKAFDANTTYHVVVSINPTDGKIRLFMNGSKVRTKGGIGALVDHSGAIGIGGRNGAVRFHDTTASGGTGAYLVGVIDEVAIYNTALKLVHVQAHYEAAQD